MNTAAEQTDEENEIRAIIGVKADLKISDNFTVGGQIGLDYINIQSLFITPPGRHRGLITPSQAAENNGAQFESTLRSAQIISNAFLRYNKDITDKLSMTAQVYGEYVYRNFQNEGFTAFGLNPALPGSGSGFTAGNTQEGEDTNDDGILDAETELALNYVPSVFSGESELVSTYWRLSI